MKCTYSKEIADKIKAYLEEEGWNYRFDKKRGNFSFGLSIPNRLKNLNYFVCIANDDYTVYAFSPISADSNDAKQLHKTAEFLCRANFGLRNGNFELDFDDGTIRYKTYVNCEGIDLSEEMISDSIGCPAAIFSRYGDGIIKVFFSDISAVDAVMECESPTKSRTNSNGGRRKEQESTEHDSERESENERLLSILQSLQADTDDENEYDDNQDP